MLDDDRNITEVFGQQANPLPELQDALKKAAQMLGGAAFGLHAELVDGHGKRPTPKGN